MIELIVPLKLLNDHSICYKITGHKPYKVMRKIRVDKHEFSCDESSVYLVDDSGFTKSYSSTTKVRYICENIHQVEDLYEN